MSDFKVGDKVVWKDVDYAKANFPETLKKQYLVVKRVEPKKTEYIHEYLAFGDGTFEGAFSFRFKHYEEQKHLFDSDLVNYPKHYSLFPEHNIEVKDVVKLWLDRWEQDAKLELSFYQAACLKEMLCYILRAPLKNELQDLEKAQWYLNEIIKEAKNASAE